MMRIVIAVMFGGAAIAAPCSAANVPQIKTGITYLAARHALLASGWAPTKYAPSDVQSEGKELDDRLREPFLKIGAPEVGSCYPTGLGQCFGIWRKRSLRFVIESRPEGFDPNSGPTVYFYYQVRLHGTSATGNVPGRNEWDPRSADIVPGSFPAGQR